MPRGRQYYDPIVQMPDIVEGEQDLSRIELYPEGGPDDPKPKWRARLVGTDGTIAAVSPGDFDHDNALGQAQVLWPGLTVYELRDEGQDSTWEGHGPSPRLWQNSSPETGAGNPPVDLPSGPSPDAATSGAGDEHIQPAVRPAEEQAPLRIIPINEPGIYVRLDDICGLLEIWAVSYETDKNPSGALALREAVDALKEIG